MKLQKQIVYLIANFGGPRTLQEVKGFLRALLTDQEVLRTHLPQRVHNLIFNYVARLRAKKVMHDYAAIGGGSPIYFDTEAIAAQLRKQLAGPVLTFHRYLLQTHPPFFAALQELGSYDEMRIFPMFPQFTYAVTGSIVRFFSHHVSKTVLEKMRWIKSYPIHCAFIEVMQEMIATFLAQHQLQQQETVLLFSAHGLPQSFICQGDPYQFECYASFEHIMQAFPQALGILSFQSKFGPGAWIRPYTSEVCQQMGRVSQGRKSVVIVPLSFTSDHIETLFEIEQLYLPLITQQGLHAFRLPAMNRHPLWLAAIQKIFHSSALVETVAVMRGG